MSLSEPEPGEPLESSESLGSSESSESSDGTDGTSTDRDGAEPILASEVQVGDVLRSRDGTEFTVSRIEPFPMFGTPLLAFIEDTETRWFKMPSAQDGEVTRVRQG